MPNNAGPDKQGHPKIEMIINNPRMEGEWLMGEFALNGLVQGNLVFKNIPFRAKDRDQQTIDLDGVSIVVTFEKPNASEFWVKAVTTWGSLRHDCDKVRVTVV